MTSMQLEATDLMETPHLLNPTRTIMGVDVGTRNLSFCTLRYYNAPDQMANASRFPAMPVFDVVEWDSVDLGQGTIEQAVKSLTCFILSGAIDVITPDLIVIEQQMGGRFGNPTMKAISHAIQGIASSIRRDTGSVRFFNASRKFTIWGISLPHEKPSRNSKLTAGQRNTQTKNNSIHMCRSIMKRNTHVHAREFEYDFNDRCIQKHQRKDLADSFGMSTSAWALRM